VSSELRPGDSGRAVRHARSLLERAGYSVDDPDPSHFGPSMEEAVRSFQAQHLLPVTGVIDPATFRMLASWAWRLGERMLYLRRPYFRGQDVEELQEKLSALGFHEGRCDGIFGPETEVAVREFQRHAGLYPDGIVGPATLATLKRLAPRFAPPGNLPSIKEALHLQAPDGVVFIAESGGLSHLLVATARELRSLNLPHFQSLAHSADTHVREANTMKARVAVLMRMAQDRRVKYFKSSRTESSHGRSLASLIATAVEQAIGHRPEVVGCTETFLARTRCPAAILELPQLDPLSQTLPELAAGLAKTLNSILRPSVHL
jgi:hypothetical protein